MEVLVEFSPRSTKMDTYVILTAPPGSTAAYGLWVQPMKDGSMGHVQPVCMTVQILGYVCRHMFLFSCTCCTLVLELRTLTLIKLCASQ